MDGAVSFTHHQGCYQTPLDIKRVNEVLIDLGGNLNLASVLLVSLGSESTAADEVVVGIRKTGKWGEVIGLQEMGGAARIHVLTPVPMLPDRCLRGISRPVAG